MKVDLAFLKLVLRVLILLILFVMLFFISAFLYSARYWKDVYSYLTPNITIKRIPTISELNLTELEYTTEGYSTTEFYDYSDLSTTEDGSGFDYYNLSNSDEELLPYHNRGKREAENFTRENDYSVLPNKTVVVDYFLDYEDFEDKDKTDLVNKKVVTRDVGDAEVFMEMNETEHVVIDLITPSEQHYSCNTNVTKEDLADVVFPWIAAVFIRNGTTNAFEYVCDGAVISDRAVITAGHCLSPDSMPRPPRDVIVILGKRNQRDMTSNDIHKVSEISVNAYYSVIGNHISHDLAILKLETPTVLDESVDAACTLDFDLTDTDTVVDAITTGWNDNGELTPIHFETLHNVQNNTFCLRDYAYQHVFCDTIGFDVQICPSYGGIYAIKLSNHNWYLKGILSADTSKKGVCVDRNLRFTNLGESEYKNWLRNVMKV